MRNWSNLLEEFNEVLLKDKVVQRYVEADVLDSGWLGRPPATKVEIDELEESLNVVLPPSYRDFLLTSNGWEFAGWTLGQLYGTCGVDVFGARNHSWLEAWTNGMYKAESRHSVPDDRYFAYGPEQDPCTIRVEYLETAIEVSDSLDSDILLLNPKVTFENGEFEAWHFGNKLAGAYRYRSFYDLIAAMTAQQRKRTAGCLEVAQPGIRWWPFGKRSNSGENS